MIWIILIGVFLFVFLLLKNFSNTGKNSGLKVEKSTTKILECKSENTPTKIFIENNRFADDNSKITGSFNIAIKGLYYRTSSEQNRAKKIELFEELFLEKEFGNPKDQFAVKVKTWDGYFIGYVESGASEHITKMINKGFKINCFLSKSTNNNAIPYQYMDVYYLGQNPKYKPPQSNNVIYVDYNIRIKRLKENIKRCEIAAEKAQRENIRNNALNKISGYKIELEKLEKIKSDIENNENN